MVLTNLFGRPMMMRTGPRHIATVISGLFSALVVLPRMTLAVDFGLDWLGVCGGAPGRLLSAICTRS